MAQQSEPSVEPSAYVLQEGIGGGEVLFQHFAGQLDFANPTSSFLRTKLFCINELVLLLVTIYGLHPCISG